MIAIDGFPLLRGPHSVARAVEALVEGWEQIETAMELSVHVPVGKRTARQARSAHRLGAQGAAAFLSPWSAFPDLSRLGVPVVAMVHELPFVRHGPLEGRVRTWRHRHWLRRNVRECAAIVVPTAATRSDLLAVHPAAKDRVHVVPNGFIAQPWEAARREPDPSPYAVMVGVGGNPRMARKKGLDVALETWRRGLAPEGLRLVLVGEPALPLVGGVEARPDLDDAQLEHLVAGARVLIYPSRSEGFGYPPLEALAAGVPVVASDVPAIAEVAGDGAVLVPPGDSGALADGLRRILADEGLRRACLSAGQARLPAFAPRRAAAGIRDVLRSVGVAV